MNQIFHLLNSTQFLQVNFFYYLGILEVNYYLIEVMAQLDLLHIQLIDFQLILESYWQQFHLQELLAVYKVIIPS